MSVIFRGYSQEQLDSLLNARARVPDNLEYTDRFAERSKITRGRVRCRLNIPYGSNPRERLDLFLPRETSAGVAVNLFFHGGYWRASEKERYSFIAEPVVQAGAASVIVEYALVPSVTLDELIAQCRRAVAHVVEHAEELSIDPERVYVSGHSAGGQIVGMLMADGWQAPLGLSRDVIKGGCGISGLYDMEALRLSYLNETLGLDVDAAARNSPCLLRPATDAPLIAAVGGLEGEEFLRQNDTIAAAWGSRVQVTPMILEGLHHYSAVESLGDAHSELCSAILAQMGLR